MCDLLRLENSSLIRSFSTLAWTEIVVAVYDLSLHRFEIKINLFKE